MWSLQHGGWPKRNAAGQLTMATVEPGGLPRWRLWLRVCLPIQETEVRPLGWEDPFEKKMATHSSILTWKIPWTEKLGGLQSMGSQRVRHAWARTYIMNPTQHEEGAPRGKKLPFRDRLRTLDPFLFPWPTPSTCVYCSFKDKSGEHTHTTKRDMHTWHVGYTNSFNKTERIHPLNTEERASF